MVSRKGTVSFSQWSIGKDLFSSTVDPWERSQKLLVEIQKRTLAEQVLLLSWDTREKSCRVLGISPSREKPVVDSRLRLSLVKKGFEERRLLSWEDLWGDVLIREQLKRSGYDTLLLSPLTVEKTFVDALLIVNYSTWGDPFRVLDFVSFISPTLVLSLQNSSLYTELKRKNAELKNWTAHVEERIEEGTKKLLEKEFQYYTLFEGANDGILVHDVSGRLMEVNRVACRLLGYGKKELLNLSWNQLGISDLLHEQKAFFEKVSKKEKVLPLETILRKKDGSTFRAELSSRRVRFQGKEAVQTFVRDVSLRKMLEESLRESKEKYRILVESSLVGVFIIRNGNIQLVNSMFEKMTEYKKDELLGKNFFTLIAPEDRRVVMDRETRREEGEDVPDHYEVRFLTKSKEKRWGEVRSCRVVLDGRATVLGNFVDITQRKQLARQLLETQKMESIATLASGIAHDFNNLLGGILGYASLLLSEMSEDHPFYDDIHSISETAKRAAELTNHLLAFARGGKYRVTNFIMNKVVEEVVTLLSRTKDPSAVIETSLDRHLKLVRGDVQQIHQAILNICLNAMNAVQGEGKITIETANVTLDESFAHNKLGVSPGDYVRIAVTDTGVGMDERTKSRIFEPFFTTRPPGEGSGLGLAMVYGVVKNHDGSILVDSELGKGTRVRVFLPVFEERKEIKRRKRAPEPGKDIRVLLVDDEKVIREVGRRMLERGGFEVLLAANGKDAVDIYKKSGGNIDLVLLDLIMPEMGGKETYRRIREIDPEVRVVFTSGYGPYDRPGFTYLEEEFFIQKPFQTETLIQIVRDALGFYVESK